MPIPRLAAVLGGLLLSRGGRRIAGRHGGKLALASLALEIWRRNRDASAPRPTPSPRRRWSGRRP